MSQHWPDELWGDVNPAAVPYTPETVSDPQNGAEALIVAAGIRGYIAAKLAEYRFHEPLRDVSLLTLVSDDADGIAAYVLGGLRRVGCYPSGVDADHIHDHCYGGDENEGAAQ